MPESGSRLGVAANEDRSFAAAGEHAGAGCMELLLFSLGGNETFGISVFKVREVTLTPRITPTPHMPAAVLGVISLRGSVIPVIDLARFLGIETADPERCSTLMVTELCGRVQGFLVSNVDRITRIEWDQVKTPDHALTGSDGMITAIARLPDARLVSILDVEQILADAFGCAVVPEIDAIPGGSGRCVLFADDSPIARREIAHVLEQLGVRYQPASNGAEAWEKLQVLANAAHAEGAVLDERLSLVLTDAEMPEMDGYTLARRIKSDPRFAGIPVVMHTSLSARSTALATAGMGIAACVTKFDAAHLADTLRPLLARPALAA